MGIGCGVVAGCTYHIPAAPLRVTYRNTYTFLKSTFMYVVVNVAVQILSHSFTMEISDPDWRWRKMCDFLALVDNKGLRLSSDLWIDCTRIPSGRITCGPCCVLNLFTQGVSTFM